VVIAMQPIALSQVEQDKIQLTNTDIFRQQAFISGLWLDAENGATIDVLNPATGGLIGAIPNMSASEAQRAVAAANAALPSWRNKTAKERSTILKNWHALMMAHEQDLARLLTAEQGKPLAEARGEVAYGATFIEWFAEEAKRVYGDIIPGHMADKRILVRKEPVGVVAAITPWNFPIAMITRKVGAALAAGCTIVVKPSEFTPFSALAIAVLAQKAGVPDGVLNVITGDAASIGQVMTGDPRVRKLSFTGSTRVGKLLLKDCADTVKKVSLELGGNAPFIVFDDADIDAAIEGALASKFRNTGQTCICANRLYVQSAVYDTFAEKLSQRVASFRIGDGLAGETEQGPLINVAALKKVEQHVADAVQKGAVVKTGGKRTALGGTFFEPTVLTNCNSYMAVAHEETFGPVAALFRFDTEAEVVAAANDTTAGLAAYVYTQDLSRFFRVSEELEYGMVGVNTGLISTELAPFGGMKESGLGREGSRYGIEDYLEKKYVCIGEVKHG
jgi:succinate-semialdehyde dehydrogenase / glutarate-semialdehyde dehydrogenase